MNLKLFVKIIDTLKKFKNNFKKLNIESEHICTICGRKGDIRFSRFWNDPLKKNEGLNCPKGSLCEKYLCRKCIKNERNLRFLYLSICPKDGEDCKGVPLCYAEEEITHGQLI